MLPLVQKLQPNSNACSAILIVDAELRTSLPDVYAAGDCAMVSSRLTGKAQWSPMGSSANMEGRTLAHVIQDCRWRLSK